MAHPASHARLTTTILFMSHLLVLATASLGYPCPCPYTCENELNWRLYLKQVAGAGPDHNQEVIFRPQHASPFGVTAVQDWTLLDAPAPGAKVLGHAQGVHIMSDLASVGWFVSLNMVFQGDRFSGSTLQVMGVIPPEGEWAVVGGTGELALARGTIKHRIVGGAPETNFRQLDIHAFYANGSASCVVGTSLHSCSKLPAV
ncbi:Jasmonate-induced protein [Zea mays]|uniref:Dirigent protein n=1 Tax=Zea mays TaxID=4577 RepID=A0A1D6KIE6_MAIZE|nr:Jasmonate-induced protein [Zea mays]